LEPQLPGTLRACPGLFYKYYVFKAGNTHFENENYYFEAFPVRKQKYRKMEYKVNVEDRACSTCDGRG
jgi:hypothetical protein